MATPESLVAAYAGAGRTIATAESLTGGLLGATITGVAGASNVYRGGWVVYATAAKADVGGLDPALLRHHGAVSAWTVEQLALNVAAAFGADVGCALSGVAGPDPQEGRPAGTVWLGVAQDGAATSRLLQLGGDRAGVRRAAVEAAVGGLVDLLGG